jgi:hypothetical protein
VTKAVLRRLGALVWLLSAQLSAQELVWQAIGQADVSRYGQAIVDLGDLDGDGYSDWLNYGYADRATYAGTALHILSGRTGALLRSRQPLLPNYHYVAIARAGDWDGDGINDYAATRYAFAWPFDMTFVEVLSGRDDRTLFSVPCGRYTHDSGGENILSDLDTDGDGRPDLVCSASAETPQGGIYVFRRDGSVRYRVALTAGQTVVRLGTVGDIDGDGCDDFGHQHADPNYPGGAVRVVSGRTGAPLVTGSGDASPDGLGTGAIVGCGDVDGDGTPDFVASSHGSGPILGIVRVFSGRDGHALWTFRKAFPPSGGGAGFGHSLASGFDLDQDGIQDLIVGGCGWWCDQVRYIGQRVFIYLLRDGREIEICTPGLSTIHHFTVFGTRVAAGSPQRGNAFPVFACGEWQYGRSNVLDYQGRVTLFRLPPSALRPYHEACSGTLGRAPRAGMVDLGTRGVRVHLSDAPSGVVAALLIGNSNRSWAGRSLPLKLEPFGFPGCELATSVLVELCTSTGTQGNAAGYASLDVALPIVGGSGRGTLHAQWLVLGQAQQAPGALSGALSWPY